jgi:probable HAF family extracellular repeat protein
MQSAFKVVSRVHDVRRALIVFTLLAVAAFQPAAGQSFIIRDLGALPGGFNYSNALGINERGQVVGYSITAGGNTHACLFENGMVTDLGTLPGDNFSEATGITESGQIAGNSTSHAILWTREK